MSGPKTKDQRPKTNLKREFSAGCVVFKRSNDQRPTTNVLFLLGKHSGYHKWVLPKGLIEKGERGCQTCLRETAEEMGIQARLISENPIHKLQYFYVADLQNNHQQPTTSNQRLKTNDQRLASPRGGPKRRVAQYQENGGQKTKVFKIVTFYLAEYVSGDPSKHDWEMEDAGWYSFEDAFAKLAFPGEKQALQKAQKILP